MAYCVTEMGGGVVYCVSQMPNTIFSDQLKLQTRHGGKENNNWDDSSPNSFTISR